MYKLLLATSSPEVIDSFAAVSSYESMGFRKPVIVSTCDEAISMLSRRQFDGIAFELGAQDDSRLNTFLMENYPILPVYTAGHSVNEITGSLEELSRLLSHIRADLSNDEMTEADMLQICRHNFLRTLLDGQIREPEQVKRSLKLLRSRMDPDQPCVVVTLTLPGDDNFFAGRWHYGPERLETALRNFFGVELHGLRILASVMPDERIRVLCCPMLGCDVDSDSMTGLVMAHLQNTIALANEYLGISLSITGIDVPPTLCALASAEEQP